MKHLPDGMHTVYACCIFENMKYTNMIRGKMKDEKKKIRKEKDSTIVR
jgi:hypothetical protein